MDLIIVESPTKAKTLARFLGDEYKIEATFGHIRDLPKSSLGVDIEHDFTPHYVIPAKLKKRAKELAEIAKDAKKIILATDPDREGEAIAYHVRVICKNSQFPIPNSQKTNKFVRIVFHEISESAIKEALANPRDIDMNLVNSQQARRVLDRLVGYKLSPLLWYKVRKGLSAGRVQSVAVRMIVEREREIEKFVPEKYWEIDVWLEKIPNSKFQIPNNQKNFKAKLIQIDGEKAEIKSEERAKKIKDDLLKSDYQVKSLEVKNVNRYPYPPFNTSTMIQACANLYGWPAKKTMNIAQQLFEGGFITYHRTDSFNLAMAAISQARKVIKENYGENYLPDKPKFYKTKSKVAQEAHEAIRPVRIINYKSQIPSIKELGNDALKLYELIWKRMVACQVKEAVDERTTVEVMANSLQQTVYILRAIGTKQLFDGWLRVYNSGESGENWRDEGRQVLPPLSVEERLKLREVDPIEVLAKQTEPPSRYNEASLIKALEEYGIGRPSTYAPIISTIKERMYVEKIEGRFQPTSLGFAVNDFLLANFPEILDYQFTAHIEDNLDKIANGEISWVPVIREFYTPFAEKLAGVYKNAQRVKIETEETGEACPKCGAPLVVRLGKFGKFLACSKFPECQYTTQYIQKTGIKCPKCGGEVILRQTKRRKKFYGCLNYPKCNFASWRKPIVMRGGSDPKV